jgi:hypothetical protein
MNRQTVATLATLTLAELAGYCYGGWPWGVITALAAGALVSWKYA